MNIVIQDYTIEIDGQPYKKGWIRPVQVGDNVSLIFPWFNNQSIWSGKWQDITFAGVPCVSAADFKAFQEANFYDTGADLSLYELLANKATTFLIINNTLYPTVEAVENRIQAAIVASGATVDVRLFTMDALPNTPVYDNGVDGVGATLTSSTNSVLVVNGIALDDDDRLGIGGQADNTTNGVFKVISKGVAGVSPWSIERATDFDEPSDINSRRIVPAQNYVSAQGTENDVFFVLVTEILDIGVDAFLFEPFTYGSNVVALNTLGLGQFPATSTTIAELNGLLSGGAVLPIKSEKLNVFANTTAAELQAMITGKTFAFIEDAITWAKAQRSSITDVADGATIAIDLSLSNYFRVAPMAGNRTVAISGIAEGQSGKIDFWQDATGSRIITWFWGLSFINGADTLLSTGAYVKDALTYSVDKYATFTFTVTVATPGVLTKVAHGLVSGQKVRLTTTGALPTNLDINTTYWAHVINADTFHLSTTRATLQAGTYIATTGTQSGVHTLTVTMITATLLKDVNS